MARHTDDYKFIVTNAGNDPTEYGVEAGHMYDLASRSSGLRELHGGFRTKEKAEAYARELRETFSDYAYVKVVTITTTDA